MGTSATKSGSTMAATTHRIIPRRYALNDVETARGHGAMCCNLPLIVEATKSRTCPG